MSAVNHHRSDNVVSLYEHRQRHDRSAAKQTAIDEIKSNGISRNALLIPLAEKFCYSASVEIDFLPDIQQPSSRAVSSKRPSSKEFSSSRSSSRRSSTESPSRNRGRLLLSIRKLLHQEFGNQRVRREQSIFSVHHHDCDELIAGLLRVQFYAKEILFTHGYKRCGRSSDNEQTSAMSVTWGVGRTLDEAASERRKRRHQKDLHR